MSVGKEGVETGRVWRWRPRLSYANVIATLALFFVLGGGAFAAVSSYVNVGPKGEIQGCVENKGRHFIEIIHWARQCPKRTESLVFDQAGRQGTQGVQGPQGVTGQQGPQGTPGPTGAAGAPAVIARTRLDVAHAQATTTSMTFAQVETLGQFTKQQANTVLRITYNTQIDAPSGDFCFVQLRVDGLNDEGGSSATTGTGSEAGETNGSTAATVFAVFTGVSAGAHTLSVWERSSSGGTCTENTGGWPRSAFVEEGP